MTTDLTQFLEAAEDTTIEFQGLLRIPDENGEHGQRALFVCLDNDFEHVGPVLFAVVSAGTELDHVTLSVHAFVDGKRVKPDVLDLGDELVVTLKNA